MLQFDKTQPHLVSFYDAVGLGDVSILSASAPTATLKTVTFPADRPEVCDTHGSRPHTHRPN